MSKKKKFGNLKKIGEVMSEMDTPHKGFDLGEDFQKNGASCPASKPSYILLNAFQNSFEPVGSECVAEELFTIGRLREYFQAWVIPKMPDPLPAYLEELDYMGFQMRVSFDGTPCVMVRYRRSFDTYAEEVKEDKDLSVYTDDWQEDLEDLRPVLESIIEKD